MAPPPWVKVCGLTRAEDLTAARDLGVWALGFVFAPSPRRVEPDVARRLLETAASAGGGAARESRGAGGQEGRPLIVGVFADSDVGEIVRVVDEVGLDAVQLHSTDGPDAGEVAEALGGARRATLIIRAVPVDAEGHDSGRLWAEVARAAEEADIVLLDTRVRAGGRAKGMEDVPVFGGSGKAFDWRLAREAARAGASAGGAAVPLLVAGGIGPDNVLEALSESEAWGVDVSSGVESAPGVKDAVLMERLVARVREGIKK